MIRCYRDSRGRPRVDVGDIHPSIGRFLEGDVQGSINNCKAFLAEVEAVEQGRLPESSGTGNAYAVTIRPAGVTLECIWDESLGVTELSLEEFKQCLKVWLECISSPPESK